VALPPLTRAALEESLGDKIAEAFSEGQAPADGTVLLGRLAAKTVTAYFTESVEGAPPAGGDALIMILLQALWQGKVPAEEIEAFFAETGVSWTRLFAGWRSIKRENPEAAGYTLAVLPGKMTDLEITQLAELMFIQRSEGDEKAKKT